MTPFLDIAGLQSGYGPIKILWGVDLVLPTAGIACLIGANGAGKTTLLRTISGLLPARSGKIVFRNTDITNLRPDEILAHGIAHVPEGRRLFASMTVQDNILMGAYGHRGLARQGLDQAYGWFPRLAERRHQDAATLSGGEQQMCAIARGLMSAPKLLLIDELSLGLAPRIVDDLIETLTTVAATGTSILLVEQDVAVALDFCAFAFVLDRGRITLCGQAADLAQDPRIQEAYLGLA